MFAVLSYVNNFTFFIKYYSLKSYVINIPLGRRSGGSVDCYKSFYDRVFVWKNDDRVQCIFLVFFFFQRFQNQRSELPHARSLPGVVRNSSRIQISYSQKSIARPATDNEIAEPSRVHARPTV